MATAEAAGIPVWAGAQGLSLRTRIQRVQDTLPPSMRRIADRVLAQPEVVRDLTITQLAHACDTSEATVVRFCRSVGVRGYAQLRLEMTSELAGEAAQRPNDPGYGEDIGPGDGLTATIAKVAQSEVMAISETLSGLDVDALSSLITSIDRAERILAYGVGASGIVAHDLAQKLVRIGRVAFSPVDTHDAMVAASLLGSGDVAVVFSHSGRTRESGELLTTAGQAGAVTAVVTNAADVRPRPDVVLQTAVRESVLRSGAMASRIAQLTVVDYIFVGVAKLRFAETVQALRSTRAGVEALQPHGAKGGRGHD